MYLWFSEVACVSFLDSCHPAVLPKDHAGRNWIAGSLAFQIVYHVSCASIAEHCYYWRPTRCFALDCTGLEVFRGRAPTTRSDVDTQ